MPVKFCKYDSSTKKKLWGIIGISDLPPNIYHRISIPDCGSSGATEHYWESDEVNPGTYEVDVFVGVSERDIANFEVNRSMPEQLNIYDDTITNYREIGASHYLNYTGTAEPEYTLINKTLQGSAIITLDTTTKFRIKVVLPNVTLTGFGQITHGYLHAKKIL